MNRFFWHSWVVLLLLCAGCDTYSRRPANPELQARLTRQIEERRPHPTPETADRILALNPEHVTDNDVRQVLAGASAPRIINIHGGVFPVHARMISFSEFLVGMGYPRDAITNPCDGTYTFSCYERSDKVAGIIAWYYEKEGLRPMIVGHSQGGFQTLKILHKFAGHDEPQLAVWNPLTWQPEDRYAITDPLTGQLQPLVGLRLGYATVYGSGGLARVLPNQWSINGRLRSVPDSVEEFTGFYKHIDPLGGDWLGYGSANIYQANGTAAVRTIRLPTLYRHGWVPDTKHLLASQAMRDWINDYKPRDAAFDVPELDVKFEGNSRNILWAAEVWYCIKKHWVLELQRYIRATRKSEHGG